MKIINISDIHIGKKDDRRLANELESFEEYLLDKDTQFDLLTISGDLFDRVLSANEFGSALAVKFIENIINITINKKSMLRIIKGTNSHDYNQLDLIKNLGKYPTFNVIEKISTENLHIGGSQYKILYLPEEYPTDYNDYYSELLLNVEDKEYDFILGHGMIDFVAFTGYQDESENRVHGTPVHKADDLIRVTKGPIIFGHIHEYKDHKNQIYYTGSYSRYSFDNTGPKGFMEFDINDNDTTRFVVNFMENEAAPTYVTINVDELPFESMTDKIKHIKELKKKYDFVKIKASNKSSLDIARKITETDSTIKIQATNTLKDDVKVAPENEYILNRELSLTETVKKFCNDKYSEDISADTINIIINEENDANLIDKIKASIEGTKYEEPKEEKSDKPDKKNSLSELEMDSVEDELDI